MSVFYGNKKYKNGRQEQKNHSSIMKNIILMWIFFVINQNHCE